MERADMKFLQSLIATVFLTKFTTAAITGNTITIRKKLAFLLSQGHEWGAGCRLRPVTVNA